MPKALVILATGFEEVEAVAIIDVLRRADIRVDVAGVDGVQVRGAHAITIHADTLLADKAADSYDVVVLPGGMPGAATLRENATVQRVLKAQHARQALVAAICAAPIALAQAGILEGKRAACFPGFEEQLVGARTVDDDVVKDGNVITSRGPGTALRFALAIVEALKSKDKANELARRMLVAA